jgi:prophage maintenance system killer protein
MRSFFGECDHAHGSALANSHPIGDKNKRVAFQAKYVLFGLNGFPIEAPFECRTWTVLRDVVEGFDGLRLSDG